MTKSKRSRPVPTDYEQSIADIVKQSKKRAVESLDSYLQICNVVEDDRRDLIKVIETALSCQKERASQDQLPTSPESSPASPLHTATTRARTKSTATSSDEHDEVCDVCEKGGDLLCCDTCTLVFHLSCLRPPLAVIPKGKWSCPHCVVDGLGSGDKEAARRSVAAMSRTSHETLLRRQFPGNFNISKSNKRFVVRRLVNGRTSEVGRFESLEEALSSLPEIQQQKKKDNADAAREKYSDVSDEADEDEDDEDGLWCTHCMDDHDILTCAFCGCQACFGKQQSEYLLMCDGEGCDAEYHTFCLNPQLTEIPVSSWYCEGCHANHRQNPADLKKQEKYPVQPKLSSKLPLRDPVGKFARKSEGTGRVGRPRTISSESVQSVQSTGSRGRGRPPGSGKQRLESAERAAVVAAEAMQHQGAGGYSVAPVPAGVVGFSRSSEAPSIYSATPSIGTVSDASPRLGGSHPSEFSMKGKPGFKSVQMQQSNPRIEIPPLIASPRATVLPMSMENAKKVIERICVEPWEPVDRQLLDQFRTWASVPDLETLLEFMVSQKDALASSIKQKDPTFSLEELQKEVETEFEADKLSAAAAAAIRASIETPPSTTASESRKTKADTTKGALSRTGASSSRTTGKVSPGGTAAPKPPRMRGSPKDGKKRKTISSAAAASMSAVTSAMPSPYALLPLQGLTAVPSSVHLQLHGSNNASAAASSIYSCVPLPPTYAVALPNSTGQFAPLNMRNYGSVPSTLPLTTGIASNMDNSTLNSMMAGTHPVPTYVMQQPQGYTVNPTTSPYQHPGIMSHVSGPNAR